MSKPALDCPELAESVYEARSLLISILSTRRHPLLGGKSEGEERHSLMSMVTEVCCKAFQTCFHAFYPTTPLKWFALCQQLQHFDPVSRPLSVCSSDDILSRICTQCEVLCVTCY